MDDLTKILDGVAVIICSRPDSRRILRKAFRKINGMPALAHLLRRIEGTCPILAVPYYDQTDYRQFANMAMIYGGNSSSPLHRMADFCREHQNVEYVVRITHDDILIDKQTMIDLVKYVKSEKAGYGITPQIVEGAGVEVIARENLLHAAEQNKDPVEHVSYFVKGSKAKNQNIVLMSPLASICGKYRLTMDYPEDVAVLESVMRSVGNDASLDAICKHIHDRPYLMRHNQLPVVTVYTCARNAVNWIGNAINSVMDMRGDNCVDFEYIIIDDASTDGTLDEIMRAMDSHKSKRIRLIVNEENLGLSSSCNIAIANARGRYIMRVDADDTIIPWALSRMVTTIKRTGAVAVYANFHEGDFVPVDAKISHHAGCALFDTKMLNEIRFTEGLRHWDSHDLYIRIKDRFPITYIDEPLWYYRRHPGSMSVSEPQERDRILADLNGKHNQPNPPK